MKRFVLLLLAPALLAACAEPDAEVEETASAETPREVPEYSIEQFLDTVNYSGASFSPDRTKVLVSSDETGVANAYALSIDGGEAEQLTTSTESVYVAGYFPEDERFIFQSDQGGNELFHVYVRELDGTITDLTPGDNVRALFFGWSTDDTGFYYGTNERDPKYVDLYFMDIQNGYESTRLYENTEGLDVDAMSPDRKWLALSKTRTTADSDVYLYELESGEMVHLTPHEGNVNNSAADFSADSQRLYLVTDAGSEYQHLVKYDLSGFDGETVPEPETVLQPDWDVAFAYVSRGGRYLVAGINNDARTELVMFEEESMSSVSLPELSNAEVTSVSISPDDRLMAFYASTSRTPRDLYVQTIGSETDPKKLTRSLNATIDPENLVEGKVVRFASFDGLEVPGILYQPHQASDDQKVPALVWVHGGPGGQSRLGYSALIQYLVNHGYAIYAINNRGSSGYGKTFFHLDDQAHGEGDLDDCVAAKQMLIDTGWVKDDEVGIIGGSYGGYMVLAALAFRPDVFDVGVDIFGVSNWVRTLESIPPWWESFREALMVEMGSDPEYLRSISPLFHADKIQKPLLVLQGANDPRVLKVESDEIVAAVEANGVPVEYVVFEDEGHGFRKKENQAKGYRAILDFLDSYLAGDGAAEADEEPAELDEAA